MRERNVRSRVNVPLPLAVHGSTGTMGKERRCTGHVWMAVLRTKRHAMWRWHHG